MTIFPSQESFGLSIYCQFPQVSFCPIPLNLKGVFTWKQNPVSLRIPLKDPEGTWTYRLFESGGDPHTYQQIVEFRHHHHNPCVFQDIVEAVNSREARSRGIRRFWEDFFSRYYTVSSESRLQVLVAWQIIRFGEYGLPIGLYAKVENRRESSSHLRG